MNRATPITAALFFALSGDAFAHTVWLRQDNAGSDTYQVHFGGHANAPAPHHADKLKSVEAFDADGGTLPVRREGGASAVRLVVEGTPALIAVHYDNGIHTRAGSGPSVPRPMNEVPGATRATHALKYHKTIVRWGTAIVAQPLEQPFEVLPVSSAAPLADEPMRVRVLINGEPASGISIGRGEDNAEAVTDARGEAEFTPREGFNLIWAGRRVPVSDDPRVTELSYEYALGFMLP